MSRPTAARSARFWALLLALLAAASLLRSVRIEADPPPDLTRDGIAEYTDEGFKTYNARNRVLVGRWLWHPDDDYTFWIRESPVSLRLHAAWFRIVGAVDVTRARALHILASMAGILAWALLVRRERGDALALGSAAILALCFVGAMYDRLALLENLLPPLNAGILWFLIDALRARSRKAAAAGVAAAALVALLAFLTKRSTVLFIAPVGASLAWIAARRWVARGADPARRARVVRLAAGFVASLGAGAYLLLIARPDLLEYLTPVAERSPLAVPVRVLRNLAYFEFETKVPFLLWAAVWAAWAQLSRPWREGGSVLTFVSAVWLAGGIGMLALFEGNADRTRYYLFLLQPLSLLAAEFAAAAIAGTRLREAGGTRPRAAFLIVLAFAVVSLSVGFYHQLTDIAGRWALVEGLAASPDAREVARLLAFPAASGLVYLAALAVGWSLWRRGRTRAVVAALAILTAAVEVRAWAGWLDAPRYEMRDARLDLARRLPPDAVVAGQWAPALTLGTPLRCLPLHLRANIAGGRLARLAPTHLLLNDDRPEENGMIDRLYPGLIRSDRQLTTYRIARFVVRLYRVEWPSAAREAGR